MENTKALPAAVMEWVRGADRDQFAGLLLTVAGLLLSGGGPDKPRPGKGRMLTTRAAAELVGMSPGWMYGNAPNLPFARKLGRSWRFDEAGLREWMQQQHDGGDRG
jgi:predicted DNA-binding transcriptional regulator AlpA